jgi:hypothetical protein
MISQEDLKLFEFADDPDIAFRMLKDRLTPAPQGQTPDFAHSQKRSPTVAR